MHSKALPALLSNQQELERQTEKTYSGEEWAGRNMKLEVIDYLSTQAGLKASPAQWRAREKRRRLTSCLFLPEGASDKAITHQTADL